MPTGAEGVIHKKRRRREWRAAAPNEHHLDSLSTAALEETCTCFTINYLRIIRNNIFRTKECQILYCTWGKKARVNARHLDYHLFHPMYLWKWSLIWLTAVEISQQSNNSPVIQSRAVKYYSDKSFKSPLKHCPCSGISHNWREVGAEKRAAKDEEWFSPRENHKLRTEHAPPGRQIVAGRQSSRGYGLSKNAAGIFTTAIQYSKGLNLLLATCWNRSEDLSGLCYSWLLQILLILLVERGGDGPRREEPHEQTGQGQIWNEGSDNMGKEPGERTN